MLSSSPEWVRLNGAWEFLVTNAEYLLVAWLHLYRTKESVWVCGHEILTLPQKKELNHLLPGEEWRDSWRNVASLKEENPSCRTEEDEEWSCVCRRDYGYVEPVPDNSLSISWDQAEFDAPEQPVMVMWPLGSHRAAQFWGHSCQHPEYLQYPLWLSPVFWPENGFL